MSFGEPQGIFGVPHNRTYQALSVVEILSLQKKDWSYLLKFFPASRQEIERKAKKAGIVENAIIHDF